MHAMRRRFKALLPSDEDAVKALPENVDVLPPLATVTSRCKAHHHDRINSRHQRPVYAKGLAYHPLDRVAIHCMGHMPLGNNEAKPRVSDVVGHCQQRKRSLMKVAPPPFEDPFVLTRLQQPGARWKPASTQAVRRLRPLARRRAITCLPRRVLIRALNPCVRFRRRTLGWNVRFMRSGRCVRQEKGGASVGSGIWRVKQFCREPREGERADQESSDHVRGKMCCRWRGHLLWISGAAWLCSLDGGMWQSVDSVLRRTGSTSEAQSRVTGTP